MDREESKDDAGSARLVLSIDGGGFRGLSCLLILRHLMKQIHTDPDLDPPKPCQVFDLICGSSTGGLIAILLGRFGLSCDEAIEVYEEIGATMFDGEADNGKIWGHIIHGEQFSSSKFEKKLEEIIEKHTGNKDMLFKPSTDAPDGLAHDRTRTFVTVVSKTGSAGVDAYRIRSYPTPPSEIDPSPYGHKWTIFQGARGTCAAPLYLSPLKIARGNSVYSFQDAGSSGFNNPAKIGVSEAKQVFGDDAAITLSLVGQGKDLQDARKVMEEQVDSVMNQIVESTEQTRNRDENAILRLIKRAKRTHKNIQNSPELVRRIAKQLLEVATDTEMSHSQVYEQFKRARGQYETADRILRHEIVWNAYQAGDR
ncbi:FabD/lysophospholipase-like protein [Phlegmacium glaucopus]|nr:FabD/lysophospholipase-like protein [Phlegmacium glaucopus]